MNAPLPSPSCNCLRAVAIGICFGAISISAFARVGEQAHEAHTPPPPAKQVSESIPLLEQVVVTAGRSEHLLTGIAQSVQVIDRTQIEDALKMSSNARDLIARLVPGFAPGNQTISGASETFRGRNALIMVDGIPRNTPLRDLSRILAMIDLNSVERIEVVNGASSLYGAGATGGTINFITRRGESDAIKVTLRSGLAAYTHNMQESAAPEVGATIAGRKGAFDYHFSLSAERTRKTYDGRGHEMPSDAMLGQGGADRMRNGNVSGAIGVERASRRFNVSFDWTYAKQTPKWLTDHASNPVSPEFGAPYPGRPLRENSKYITVQYTDQEFALGQFEIKALYNNIFKQTPFTKLSQINNQVYYSGDPTNPTAWFNQSKYDFDRSGINITINTPLKITLGDDGRLIWGVDYSFDKVRQTLLNHQDAIAPMRQHSIAAFLQSEIPVTSHFRMQGGVRFDRFQLDVADFTRPDAVSWPARSLANLYPAIQVIGGSFDYDAWTYNLGGVLDITPSLQTYGNFSQGYSLTDIGAFTRRAGVNSLSEICDAYGSIAAMFGCSGIPDFTISYADISPKPQLVNTIETGIRGSLGRLSGTLGGYMSKSSDGVNYDVESNRVTQQKERIWGIEGNMDYKVSPQLILGALVSRLEGKYDINKDGRISSGEYLPNNRIPTTWKGLAHITLSTRTGYRLRGEVEHYSGRRRIRDRTINAASILNLAFSREFQNGSEVSLAIRNLLDASYINPTATATRNAAVSGLGRSLFASCKFTF